jgi:CheY-like chemotaxis protein
VPLNILLADDSVPAQNMGKKILVDAGYDVLTVSNGLEALRKIAATAPDIAIMDIFMPGYTGLEVCERLRASTATAALPVILTVGKLEPYRPEDGEHVHANAVIVKPFAAAELIAAVRSLIGAPPARVADAISASAGEHSAVDTDTDPLQEISEEAPDDLLFSYGEAAAHEDAAPWASQETQLNGADLLPSDVELESPNSLAFDPDAGPTPFSASAIDLAPSESHFSAADDVSAFTEFELEPEAFADPSASTLEIPATEEASTPALSVSEPQVLMPESAVAASEEAVSDLLPPLEPSGLELPAKDIPISDSWLELQVPAPVEVLAPCTFDVAEPSEAITPDVAPVNAAEAAVTATIALAPNAEQHDEEEEARRLAFEALFNSTDPLPVEEFYASSTEVSSDTIPNMANLSENHSGDIVPDSEIESLIDASHYEFFAPEPDPYLMRDEAVDAASRIPDRDPLLDPLMEDGFETDWSIPESELEPTQSASAIPVESDLPSDGVSTQLDQETPSVWTLDDTPSEAPWIADEALPVTQETTEERAQPVSMQLAETQLTEIEETAFEPAFAQLEAVPEIGYSEARQPPPEPEPSEPELPEPEMPPVQEPGPTPEPVKEPEPQPEPVPPEKLVSLELTDLELAESQSATEMAEIPPALALSPEAREAERIQQAVDRVLDRFKRLLVKAIVRELARPD